MSEEFAEVLIDYVRSEGEGIPKDNRLVGTTEVLEGLFGGYKRMVGENKMSLNGLGRLILCMSSWVGEFSEGLVHQAMTNVRCKDVDAWLDRAFGKVDKKFFGRKSRTVTQEGSLQFLTPQVMLAQTMIMTPSLWRSCLVRGQNLFHQGAISAWPFLNVFQHF